MGSGLSGECGSSADATIVTTLDRSGQTSHGLKEDLELKINEKDEEVLKIYPHSRTAK